MPYISDSDIPGKGISVRPIVARMAISMEVKLAKHDAELGQDGWRTANFWDNLRDLKKEYLKLVLALTDPDTDPVDVWMQAANLSNIAAMCADIHQIAPIQGRLIAARETSL